MPWRPIRFETAANVGDDQYNQPIEFWAPLAKNADDWAELIANPGPSGAEFTQADQQQANVTRKWKVRYRTDITAAMRFMDRNETTETAHNITAVYDPDGRRHWLTIETIEQTTGATTATS